MIPGTKTTASFAPVNLQTCCDSHVRKIGGANEHTLYIFINSYEVDCVLSRATCSRTRSRTWTSILVRRSVYICLYNESTVYVVREPVGL